MKNAIVTGAARGIGRVIANRLADDGWRVGLADISIAAIENEEPLRAKCGALEADVSKPESIAAALAAFGATPDLLVNNAGIVRFGPLLTLAQSDFEAVVNVNLVGTFSASRQVAALMIADGKPGNIISISSMNGIVPGPNSGAYTATKAAIALLTKQMAVEWGPNGIRVNAIAPGLIDAGMSNAVHADLQIRQEREARIPLRRLGTAEDIANLVAFLASDQSSYITGENILVDGGIAMSILSTLPRPKSVDSVGPSR
jgi:NAD(P)-dependent dehydrogenase (short-subunit alcohol dehydrogenase family)